MIYKIGIETENVWDEKRMNNFSVLKITLSMERNALYFLIEMLIPCVLISCLTILGQFKRIRFIFIPVARHSICKHTNSVCKKPKTICALKNLFLFL